jgi:hypothetical protein
MRAPHVKLQVSGAFEFSINKELSHDSDPQQQWYNKQRRFAPGI